MKQKTKGETN